MISQNGLSILIPFKYLFLIIYIYSFAVNGQIDQPDNNKPSPRWGNECVLLTFKGSLLCYGGQLENGLTANSMHLLNLNQSWNTTDPAWSVIETAKSDRNEVTIPSAFFAATYLPSSNKFLIDGGTVVSSNVNNQRNQTLYYDTVNELWVNPIIKGQSFIRRKQHTAVSDDQGRVWIWGGLSDASTYGGETVYHNTWVTINTQTWTASYPNVDNNPPPRIDHTATLISGKYILIIGGVVYSHDVTDLSGKLALNPVSMSSLLLFDMTNNKWINVNAGGNIPAPRRGHSAVLSLDGKSVIVFGGGMPEDEREQLNDVFILELTTMRWIAPSIKGVPPKPRRYHKAYLVEDYMLVTFGLSGDNTGFDDVNILSTTSWSWVIQYNPNASWLSGNTTTTGLGRGIVGNDTLYDPNIIRNDGKDQNNSSETRIKAGVIAGVVSGGVVILGGGIFLILSVVIFKRKQLKIKKSSNSNIVDPVSYRQDNDSIASGFMLEPMTTVQMQKPDNRSSICYATQLENGELYKPNEKNEDD